MIEVEIKVKISDPEEIRRKFKEHGGKYVLSLHHEDTYFNMPPELRDFRKSDEALRIRKSTEFHKFDSSIKEKTHYFVTYKGKKMDTTTKSRNELETLIEEGNVMKEIFISLGFREIFTVKKERELHEFEYDGNKLEALIDYIPLLKGYFIEVEMKAEDENELAKSSELLFGFLEQFGIHRQESIRKSYLELIADKFKKKK